MPRPGRSMTSTCMTMPAWSGSRIRTGFWDQHPEWREKTALGTDAHVDWRFLMNLQNPHCLKAVLADAKGLLSAYDWDGVDIGELTFDSLQGPDNPGAFTPFNAQARDE